MYCIQVIVHPNMGCRKNRVYIEKKNCGRLHLHIYTFPFTVKRQYLTRYFMSNKMNAGESNFVLSRIKKGFSLEKNLLNLKNEFQFFAWNSPMCVIVNSRELVRGHEPRNKKLRSQGCSYVRKCTCKLGQFIKLIKFKIFYSHETVSFHFVNSMKGITTLAQNLQKTLTQATQSKANRSRSQEFLSTVIKDFQIFIYLGNYWFFRYGLENRNFIFYHIIDIRNEPAQPGPA